MLLRRIAVENVRSFLGKEELHLDGLISIIIGPNGGGKTNLLDIAVIVLRRYLYASLYPVHAPRDDDYDRYEFRSNDALNNMRLEPHSNGQGKPQNIEVDLEVTERDLENMQAMKQSANELMGKAGRRYVGANLQEATDWNLNQFTSGMRFTYKWSAGALEQSEGLAAQFRQYLHNYEIDGLLRDAYDLAPLSTPMLYLPVSRSVNGFQSHIALAGYNHHEQKRQLDAAISRTNSSIVPLAVSRLALQFRLLLDKDLGGARKSIKEEPNLKELTRFLRALGYEWELETRSAQNNEYNIRLTKQGTSFLVGAASSGEQELLTYLFAIFALNVRDALIVVDEPELHLHPRWQKKLFELFVELTETTGNQFLMATHSPTFVSPESIQFISRVFSHNQESKILRLAASDLPNAKHLLQIINSENNERIFFADEVVLVEGLSDRIFFDAVLDDFDRAHHKATLEIIGVGGKTLFTAYGKVLHACHVPYSIIADLDYIEQVGDNEVKQLLIVDAKDIKKNVFDDPASKDGQSLFERVDEAIKTGNWQDAQAVWEYIKSRRKKLKTNMTSSETALLDQFVLSKRGERIYLLRRGSLEDYLPEGLRDKDIEKLIAFVSDETFWDRLADGATAELRDIVVEIMPVD